MVFYNFQNFKVSQVQWRRPFVMYSTYFAKDTAAEPQTSNDEAVGDLCEFDTETGEKKSCCLRFIKVIYVATCVINILLAVAVIAVTVSAAIAMRIFSSEQSGKLVAMILLAVLAAVTLSITIYAMVAILRRRKKPVHTGSVSLLILAILQAIILIVAIRNTTEDEMKLSRSLSESFQLSRSNDPRHVKLWATLQYDLNCCGVYGPTDYNNPNIPIAFAPDVPISCCPSCDLDRSELVQERERQNCKARREYYELGCKNSVIEIHRQTSSSVIAVITVSILVELAISALGLLIILQCKKQEKDVSKPPEEIVTRTKSDSKASIK